MNKFLLVFLVIAVMCGCKNFTTEKVTPQQIVKRELAHLDWHDLDSYPSFVSCADSLSKQAKQVCFEQKLSTHIYTVLSQHQVHLTDSIYEKIELVIRISAEGKPSLEKVYVSELITTKIPDIKKWLNQAILSLPEIYPAEKRGIPVSAKFKLPLIIQSE